MDSQKTIENSESTLLIGIQEDDKQKIQEWRQKLFTPAEFPELFESISSEDKMKRLYGATGIRLLLTKEDEPPIQEVIDRGIVPTLIDYCKLDDQPLLQNEAAWILCNLASGTAEQTQVLVDKGVIPPFIELLGSKHSEIVEQAIFGLGNLAGDSIEIRDMIIKEGGVKRIAEIVNSESRFETKKYGVFALANLSKGSPAPELQKVQSLVPLFCSFLQKETNEDILIEVSWGLSYLSAMSNNDKPIIPMGVIPHVLKHLENENESISLACLRIIGTIIANTEDQANMLINMPGVVPKLFLILENPDKNIRKEACWVLSNIAAGDPQQIELVAGNPANLQKLIKISLSDSKMVKRESVWVLSNATSQSTSQQTERLVKEGILDCFVQILGSEDSQSIMVALQGIKNILEKGGEQEDNPFLLALKELGGIDKIEKLQDHPKEKISDFAIDIIETFCESNES